MEPSKRSSSKEEITQEIPTKITSQHFMFPQVCFLRETNEKMKNKKQKNEVCDIFISGILSKDLGLNLHGASKPKKHSLLNKYLLSKPPLLPLLFLLFMYIFISLKEENATSQKE